jgi:hypothetical protein
VLFVSFGLYLDGNGEEDGGWRRGKRLILSVGRSDYCFCFVLFSCFCFILFLDMRKYWSLFASIGWWCNYLFLFLFFLRMFGLIEWLRIMKESIVFSFIGNSVRREWGRKILGWITILCSSISHLLVSIPMKRSQVLFFICVVALFFLFCSISYYYFFYFPIFFLLDWRGRKIEWKEGATKKLRDDPIIWYCSWEMSVCVSVVGPGKCLFHFLFIHCTSYFILHDFSF